MTDAPDWLAAMEATWPPEGLVQAGPWTLRIGAGGGSRVSAASLAPGQPPGGFALAEASMRALGQRPLVRVAAAETALDAALAARGYGVLDPVVLLAAPVAGLVIGMAEAIWPPDPQAREFWAAAGIGPERIAVMERVAGPCTVLRRAERGMTLAQGFVARSGPLAFLHALEVAPDVRRQGHGAALLAAAVAWARGQGAERLALAVTRANLGALTLYQRAGLAPVAAYHYRQLQG